MSASLREARPSTTRRFAVIRNDLGSAIAWSVYDREKGEWEGHYTTREAARWNCKRANANVWVKERLGV